MKTSGNDNNSNSIWGSFLSLFTNSEEHVCADSLAEIVTKEIDELWALVREKEETDDISEIECRDKIIGSFEKIKSSYTDEQIDAAYVWPRYVKISVHSVNEPIEELVHYVNEKNYICLTKCLTNLYHSLCKNEDSRIEQNMDNFAKAVYLHILDDINHDDVPSCLELGRIAQRNGDYSEARKWYTKITETEQPFNGVTALLACYESETKAYLSKRRENNNLDADQSVREKIKTLNRLQHEVYEKWRMIMETNISQSDSDAEQYKREYVALMSGYARFERNRGHYSKAFDVLERIPEEYPDIYRVLAEKAMLYQFKPYKNSYYSLEKSIEAFRKAEAAITDKDASRCISVKGKKSVLMPLANAYFQSGRYEEAREVCDCVLGIDKREQRAVNLKKRISCMESKSA